MKNCARIVLLLLVAGSTPAFAEVAGRLISLQGRAEAKKPGTAPWQPAAIQQVLDTGDTIRTLAQSRAVVLLSDETQIKLNASTTLELRNVRQSSSLLVRVAQTAIGPGNQTLMNLGSGQVWLRSKLQPANVRVNTPAVTAAIRGTEFDLRVADDGESIITMLEGSVDFRNDQGAVLVSSGEQGRARIGQAPTKSVILRPRDAVQWVLYYPGAVSPADYPYLRQTPEQLRNTIANAEARRSTSPADRDNLLLLSRARHDLGLRAEAEEALKAILAANPGDTEAQTDLAWVYLETNRAREALDRLLKISPATERSMVATAMAYFRLGDAQQFFDTIGKVDPSQSSLAATQRAFAELLYGNAESARQILDRIPETDSGYSLAQGLLSNVLLAQNEKDLARQAAERSVAAGPRSPTAWLNRSLVEQSFFRIPEALEAARRALALDPEYVASQVQEAKMHFALGNTAEAEKIARAGLQKNSSEAALTSLLGFVLLAQAKTEEAKTYFEKSLALDSTRGEPHLGLGIAGMRQGRAVDATREILVASTVEPQIAVYQSYLGKAFYDQRRFEMAFGALDNAKSLDPNDPTPHLYAGIFYNDLSRPGRAVRELTRSIKLNNNRAVYRGRFLLDEDRATRNVNLATSYNRLYLSEWGNYEALKSQMSDPTNSSAHIFLAQTFLNLRGRTQAAGSEQLVARLLLPVNANSFNSFNDYTTLFEGPRVFGTLEGRVGSFNANTQTAISSGGTSRFAYGVIGTRFRTDGFREVNDDVVSHDGIAQFKLALTPHTDMMFLYSTGQQNQGDHGTSVINFENNRTSRRFTRRHRAEIGYHAQFRPGSDMMVYFSGQKFENTFDDPAYFPNLFGAGLRGGLRSARRNPDLNFQASHIYKVGDFQFRYGLDVFEGRARDRRTIPCCLPEFDTDFGETVEHQLVRYKNAYVHTDYAVHPRLTLTGALHYDWSNEDSFDNAPEDPSKPTKKWNPQAGVFYTPTDSTTLRFAFIRSMQMHTRERLAPTNIHGFVISQNDPALSQNESYNFGWDQRVLDSAFLRATAYYRDRDTRVLELGSEGYYPSFTKNHFHGTDVSWSQLVGDRFSIVPAYAMARAEDVNGVRHEHDSSVRAFYISPQRFWVGVTENYIHQRGKAGRTVVSDSFFTTDFSMSWEFPRKRGVIGFGVTNLFDHSYVLLVDPFALDPRVPRRQYTVTLRINL